MNLFNLTLLSLLQRIYIDSDLLFQLIIGCFCFCFSFPLEKVECIISIISVNALKNGFLLKGQ